MVETLSKEDHVNAIENNNYLSLSGDFWHLFQFYFKQVQKTIDFHFFSLPLGCRNERVKWKDLERWGLILYPEHVSNHPWYQ